MADDDNRLSTTALARKLNIPVQQLFATLKDYGWIKRVGDNWALTPKGEFEGGTFQKSRRYGAYIVWPERIDQHPLLTSIESNQRITAGSMVRYYPRLHARQINRALAEIGLQHHTILGWELTTLGESLGGQQEESRSSGAFYVTWPHEIIDNPIIHREMSRLCEHAPAADVDVGLEPDLFGSAADNETLHTGIDGHVLDSALKRRVCNWLYLAQFAHAYKRALPTEEAIYADFYLPAGNVYIDCWEEDVPAGEMSAMFRRRELYKEMGLRHLEVNADDIDRLDEVLGRGLLKFEIRS